MRDAPVSTTVRASCVITADEGVDRGATRAAVGGCQSQISAVHLLGAVTIQHLLVVIVLLLLLVVIVVGLAVVGNAIAIGFEPVTGAHSSSILPAPARSVGNDAVHALWAHVQTGAGHRRGRQVGSVPTRPCRPAIIVIVALLAIPSRPVFINGFGRSIAASAAAGHCTICGLE